MYVQRRRKRIDILAPAKLNLFLEVLRRRHDGYHEIETLMVPVSLFDRLRLIERDDDQILLSSTWADGIEPDSGYGDLPPTQSNLVYRAVQLLRERAGIANGIELELVKRIPSAAGLGGGSSDAAAALVGANQLWKLNWSRDQLAEVAGELGSDIPFFLWSGPAVCTGRGEHVELVASRHPTDTNLARFVPAHFVIVRPSFGLSTADVYRQIQLDSPRQRVDDFLSKLTVGSLSGWSVAMFNRLQEAAMSLAPWLERLRREFDQLGVVGHQLSGSGSSYFGVCRNLRQAQRAAAVIKNRGAGHVYCVTSLNPAGLGLWTCQD